MPTAPPPSNIRAFVRWKEPTVYAGEEIECIITFKNIAIPQGQECDSDEVQTPHANGYHGPPRTPSVALSSVAGSRRASIAQNISQQSRVPATGNARQPSTSGMGRGHKPALSLSMISAPVTGGLQSAPMPSGPAPATERPKAGTHGRSLSIMSMGSETPSTVRSPTTAMQRPARGHGRSASMQLTPKSSVPMRASPNPNQTWQFPRQPSPLNEATTPPEFPGGQESNVPLRPAKRRPGTVSAGHTPTLGRQSSLRKQSGSEAIDGSFRFPPQPHSAPQTKSPSRNQSTERPTKPVRTPSTMHSGQNRPTSPRLPEGFQGAPSSMNPITRVLSDSSTAGGTPRSSSEFYSMTSNHSDETLASELPQQNQIMGRLVPNMLRSRSTSRRSSPGRAAEPETLTMGYAQTSGAFTLDGSLVNNAPFEEVKRRGAQSSGGVVGVERSKSKRASGMFGGFSWGSINDSLGGLLGGDESSSLAQMNKVASSKSVPLLSTPQSLLFVDLTLAPGESRSYHYRFHVPRGLPPSHERGRAMKVQYRLLIAVQRSSKGGQTVKTTEVPFRVLGSVNGRGEMLGHDLMSPYILLQDSAKTKSMAPTPGTTPGEVFPHFPDRETNRTRTPRQGLEDFLRYTERLLENTTADPNGAIASPTSPTSPSLSRTVSRKESTSDYPPTGAKEAVELAILRSNYTKGKSHEGEQQASNRFNIARSGQSVAALTLLRPAYRLGEAVVGILDFSALLQGEGHAPAAPTYSVLIELESAEKVDPSLALRSGSSIQRVTRKVHASTRENTLFARQISFGLAIPANNTPSFETTGVSLVWRLRIEFTTQRQAANAGLGLDNGGAEDSTEDLLEELARDERGVTLIAKERLLAETFEVSIPIKVYGAPTFENVDGLSEGLEV